MALMVNPYTDHHTLPIDPFTSCLCPPIPVTPPSNYSYPPPPTPKHTPLLLFSNLLQKNVGQIIYYQTASV